MENICYDKTLPPPPPFFIASEFRAFDSAYLLMITNASPSRANPIRTPNRAPKPTTNNIPENKCMSIINKNPKLNIREYLCICGKGCKGCGRGSSGK